MADDGMVLAIGERTVKPNKGASVDFIELWRGAPADKVRGGKWKGGFSGRPGLADTLWPVIRASSRGKALATLKALRSNLRDFWRFLDAYEAWVDTKVQLFQCNEALGSLWRHPPNPNAWEPPTRMALWKVGAILRLGHRIAGTEKTFFWPVFRREPVEGK